MNNKEFIAAMKEELDEQHLKIVLKALQGVKAAPSKSDRAPKDFCETIGPVFFEEEVAAEGKLRLLVALVVHFVPIAHRISVQELINQRLQGQNS